ncbi:MAG: hypothetical protein Ct9H300mP8_00370 [Gammaproteobacteria bacterium]|nr:MAG: hypothetical protein Ct9H300mP8_00370 [Gammaproteobacteria bacterium]
MLPNPREFDDMLFDPKRAHCQRTDGEGYGYWVGGHKVYFDQTSEQFVIFYRSAPRWRPAAVAVAGGRIQRGLTFEEVWTLIKRHSPRRPSKSGIRFVHWRAIGGYN